MAYSIGSISGAHLNPAVSIGAFVAGRISVTDLIGYTVSQTIGAIIAAGMILVIATNSIGGHDVAVSGLGQNGWGAGYDGEFFMISAFIFEVVATAVFLVVILGVTSDKGTPMMAGLVIGLTLVMIHLVGISVTGTSVKPARSIGPALFVGALHCRSFGCSLLPH
jgi:aquaporin Z